MQQAIEGELATKSQLEMEQQRLTDIDNDLELDRDKVRQERDALEGMRIDFEHELQAAQSEVAKAQDALRTAEERVRAAEQVEKQKIISGAHLSLFMLLWVLSALLLSMLLWMLLLMLSWHRSLPCLGVQHLRCDLCLQRRARISNQQPTHHPNPLSWTLSWCKTVIPNDSPPFNLSTATTTAAITVDRRLLQQRDLTEERVRADYEQRILAMSTDMMKMRDDMQQRTLYMTREMQRYQHAAVSTSNAMMSAKKEMQARSRLHFRVLAAALKTVCGPNQSV